MFILYNGFLYTCTNVRIPFIKIRKSWACLIFIIGILLYHYRNSCYEDVMVLQSFYLYNRSLCTWKDSLYIKKRPFCDVWIPLYSDCLVVFCPAVAAANASAPPGMPGPAGNHGNPMQGKAAGPGTAGPPSDGSVSCDPGLCLPAPMPSAMLPPPPPPQGMPFYPVISVSVPYCETLTGPINYGAMPSADPNGADLPMNGKICLTHNWYSTCSSETRWMS